MAQTKTFHFISPDFVDFYRRFLSPTDDRELTLVVPVFYNSKVNLRIPYNGTYATVCGSEFDLMAHLNGRFPGPVYKYKVDDIFFVRYAAANRVISPVDDNLLRSGIFKFFMVVYLS